MVCWNRTWVLVVSNIVRTRVILGHLSSLSLKNHGVDEEANEMFNMGAETMALPTEEKKKFEQGDDGLLPFGYVNAMRI